MALTRNYLKSMGLTDDQINSIIEAHTETVDGLKNEAAQYKADAEKLPEVQRQLKEAKDAAKNSGDYDKLKKEFDDYKADIQNKETAAAKKAALTKVAKDAGLSEAGIAKAVKYSDLSSFDLDENGDVKDGKALIKSLKEEWPEYIQTTGSKGANTANPPAGGGKVYKSKEEIFSIKDDGERQKAIAENHELFGF